MCTSIVVNKKKTLAGWNLDLKDMEYRVTARPEGVYIEINDPAEGWMPLFGANSRGDFVGMPTCWPYDAASDPKEGAENVILLDMDLLLQRKTFDEICQIVSRRPVASVPGLTFMGALSDAEGNVLHIVPGHGFLKYEKPDHCVLTNFSPFGGTEAAHPLMGRDRFEKAEAMLKNAKSDFGTEDCFDVLEAVSQEVCPTVVSMVFDVSERTVYWFEDRLRQNMRSHKLG